MSGLCQITMISFFGSKKEAAPAHPVEIKRTTEPISATGPDQYIPPRIITERTPEGTIQTISVNPLTKTRRVLTYSTAFQTRLRN